jgi:hypothetical protein
MHNSVTVRGQWMYPRTAIPQMIRLMRSGVLDLSHERLSTFSLDDANDAVAHAAAHPGPPSIGPFCCRIRRVDSSAELGSLLGGHLADDFVDRPAECLDTETDCQRAQLSGLVGDRVPLLGG